MDVMSDQTRSLRVRGFVEYLKRGGAGAYLQIGTSGPALMASVGRAAPPELIWRIDRAAAEKAKCYPTNLSVLEPEIFDLLEQHGYEVALANQLAHRFLYR